MVVNERSPRKAVDNGRKEREREIGRQSDVFLWSELAPYKAVRWAEKEREREREKERKNENEERPSFSLSLFSLSAFFHFD